MAGWQEVAGQLAQIGLPSLGGLIGSMVLPGVGGAVGASAGKFAATAVAAALGVKAEPEAISQAIAADPNGSAVRLAEIEAESKAHADALADVANARATMVTLAQTGSSLSYGPAIVSVLVVLGFFAVTVILLMVPGLRADPLAQAVFYTLLPIFASVPAYWLGSSESSKRKDDGIQRMALQNTAPAILPMPTSKAAADVLAKASRM